MLSTPPAFILSQDQTLELKVCSWLRINIWLILFRSQFLNLLQIHSIDAALLLRIFKVALLFICQGTVKLLRSFLETVVVHRRRRRDLNPRAAINDLHPFQGCPFGQLGYFSKTERVGFEPTRPFTDKRFSRPPRYDHFDTSPCYSLFTSARHILAPLF